MPTETTTSVDSALASLESTPVWRCAFCSLDWRDAMNDGTGVRPGGDTSCDAEVVS